MFKLTFLSQNDKSEYSVILVKEVWQSEKASCATPFRCSGIHLQSPKEQNASYENLFNFSILLSFKIVIDINKKFIYHFPMFNYNLFIFSLLLLFILILSKMTTLNELPSRKSFIFAKQLLLLVFVCVGRWGGVGGFDVCGVGAGMCGVSGASLLVLVGLMLARQNAIFTKPSNVVKRFVD